MEPVILSKTRDQQLHCAIRGTARLQAFITLWLLTFCSSSLYPQSGCFSPPVSYGAGSNPRAVVFGDFNNDGKLDMATAGFANSVCISLGNGDGTFQNPNCFGSGLHAFTSNSLAVADFNKDGKLDLVVANYDTNDVAVLLGKGDGTFPTQVNYTAGTQPFGVAAGDLGNGSPDIVVGNSNGGTISVLVNKGDGTFNSAVNYAVHASPFSIAIGDINKDGKNDVIVGDTTGSFGNIDLLLSNGDGTLQSATAVVGMPPYLSNIVVGDFNNDGNLDVAANTFNVAGYVSVALGNGDGTFQPATSLASPTSYGLAAADLNGDGKLDVVLSNAGGNQISIYRGNGDGTLRHVADYLAGSVTYGVAIADLNGDGHPDVAVVNQNSNDADVFLGAICSTYHFAISTPPASTAGMQFSGTISIVDNFGTINNGYMGTVHFTSTDSVAVLPADSTLTNGTGSFIATLKTSSNQTITTTDTVNSSITGSATVAVNPAPAATFSVSLPARRTPGSAFDITVRVFDQFQNTASGYRGTVHLTNSDGRASLPADYTFTSSDAGKHKFSNGGALLTQGTQTVTATDLGNNSLTGTGSILIGPEAACFPSSPTYNADSNPYAIAAGDFRHNGKTDVAVVNFSSNDVSVSLGNGDGIFQPAVNYAVGKSPVAIGVGDFNGDGKFDIVTVNLTDNNVSVLLGNGDGTFQAAKNTLVANFANPRGLAVGDFNGDGKLDVAVSLSGSFYKTVRIMAGNGDGTFSLGSNVAAGSLPEFMIAGDFNGDGALDFAVADYGSNIITVALNNGSGSFPVTHTYTVGSTPSSIAVGDFNRDGKVDLALANFNDNNISVLRGNGDGTFQNAVTYAVGVNPTSVISGDFDGDGYPDLAVANSDPFSFNPGTVSILLGDGAGNFQAPQNFTVGLQPYSLVAADFNGDSIIDFAVANENSGGNGNMGISLNQVCPVTHLGVTAPASTIVGEAFTFNVSALNAYNRVFSAYTGIDVFGATGGGQFPFPYTFGLADNGSHQFNNGGIITSAGQQFVISHESPNNSIFGVSSAITVNQASTTATVALTSGNNPSAYGQTLTFTATVSPQFSGTPTGTVIFSDGANSLGAGTTSAGAGTWTLSTSALAGGPHTLTASYGGDANFQSSGSTALMQNVNLAGTNVTLVVTPTPFRFRQSVSYSATVSASGSTPSGPTGMVTFMDGMNPVGTGTLDGSGRASFHTSQFMIGAHVITVVYAGDTNFSGNSSAPVTFNRSPKPR